jgi:hypothetical protein
VKKKCPERMGKGEAGAWRVWKSDHVIGYRTLDSDLGFPYVFFYSQDN